VSRAFHADVHFSPVAVIFEQCAFVNGGRCPHGRAGKIGEADDADGEKDRAAIVVHIGTRVHIARFMIASWCAAPYGNANNQQGGSANALVKNDRIQAAR
jgi:hypothetical protein